MIQPKNPVRPSGIQLVIEERLNQIKHGYDAAHDDTHKDGEIAEAAEQMIHFTDLSIYSTPNRIGKFQWTAGHPSQWHLPIIAKWRRDKIKMLTIAAALLVAEIERLQRKENAV